MVEAGGLSCVEEVVVVVEEEEEEEEAAVRDDGPYAKKHFGPSSGELVAFGR